MDHQTRKTMFFGGCICIPYFTVEDGDSFRWSDGTFQLAHSSPARFAGAAGLAQFGKRTIFWKGGRASIPVADFQRMERLHRSSGQSSQRADRPPQHGAGSCETCSDGRYGTSVPKRLVLPQWREATKPICPRSLACDKLRATYTDTASDAVRIFPVFMHCLRARQTSCIHASSPQLLWRSTSIFLQAVPFLVCRCPTRVACFPHWIPISRQNLKSSKVGFEQLVNWGC